MMRWKNNSEGVTGGDVVRETLVDNDTGGSLGTVYTVVPPHEDGTWVVAEFHPNTGRGSERFNDLEVAKAAVYAAATAAVPHSA